MFRSRFRDFDWMLLVLVVLLSVIGILEIRSATAMTKFHGFQQKQIGFLVVGLIAMFAMSLVDYHRLLDIAYWAYGVSLLALVAVKLFGQRVMGGKRWINLGGGAHFQPSEWVKLVLILWAARFFWEIFGSGRKLTWRDIAKSFGLIGLPMLLVLSQPDLGTALTYTPILLVGLFLGGLRLQQAAILLVGFTVIGAVAWKSGKVLKPYQKARLTAFADPDTDPKGSGYQIRQSLIAVGSGGLWGKGANHGTQTQGDFLPIPYTDFIFAAFCEEHGFIGAIGVLLLYFFILVRLIENAQTASDPPGTFIVMGVAAVLLFQIAINIGMCVGLMPVTGIPLPLMSYGGSSVIFTYLAMGIVMNVRMGRYVN